MFTYSRDQGVYYKEYLAYLFSEKEKKKRRKNIIMVCPL